MLRSQRPPATSSTEWLGAFAYEKGISAMGKHVKERESKRWLVVSTAALGVVVLPVTVAVVLEQPTDAAVTHNAIVIEGSTPTWTPTWTAPATPSTSSPSPRKTKTTVHRPTKKASPKKKPLAAPTKRVSRKAVSREFSRDRLLDTARSYFGIPYLWGGTDPDIGLDCSGYTRLVYAQYGLSMPRTSRDQRAYFTRISTPKPGDLVFFHNSSGTVFHVGIYVSPGRMYAAPRPGKVVSEGDIWSDRVTYGRHPSL